MWSMMARRPMPCFKGGGSGGQTTVQKSEPWPGLQPHLKNLYQRADQAYEATPKEAYQGQLVADPNQTQQQALTMAEQVALTNQNLGQTAQQGAQRISQRMQGGDYVTLPNQGQLQMGDMNSAAQSIASQLQIPGINLEGVQAISPTTQGAIQSALVPLQEQLTQQILPQIQSKSIEAGAYGGQRQGVVQRQALDDFTKRGQELAAGIAYQDLARRQGLHAQDVGQQRNLMADDLARRMQLGAEDLAQQRELSLADIMDRRTNTLRGLGLEAQAAGQAANLAGEGFRQNLQPSQVLQNVGDIRQDYDQGQLDEAFQQYQLAQQAPWAGIEQLSRALQGGSQFGTSSTTVPGPSTGSRMLTGGIGGGLTGAKLFGPWGALGGAVLGGLSGLL